MPINFQNSGSRSASRAKRRKTNIILNTLITIVVLLICIIGWKVFFSDNKAAEDSTKQAAVQEEKNNEDSSPIVDDSESNEEEDKQSNDETNEESTDDTNAESEDNNGEIIEQNSDEENVEKVIVNPAWEPIGTEQTSGHESSYSKGTIDWNEKLDAAAYAIGTTSDNMTAWWVTGGNPPEQQAILTVQEKGNPDTYRVTIEWVDGQGWKPVEMKKLMENDKGQ